MPYIQPIICDHLQCHCRHSFFALILAVKCSGAVFPSPFTLIMLPNIPGKPRYAPQRSSSFTSLCVGGLKYSARKLFTNAYHKPYSVPLQLCSRQYAYTRSPYRPLSRKPSYAWKLWISARGSSPAHQNIFFLHQVVVHFACRAD